VEATGTVSALTGHPPSRTVRGVTAPRRPEPWSGEESSSVSTQCARPREAAASTPPGSSSAKSVSKPLRWVARPDSSRTTTLLSTGAAVVGPVSGGTVAVE
jgi:hypothetical protein